MSTTHPQYIAFEGFSPISAIGPYRAEDYWRLPEGAPVELMRGELVMSPAPRSSHQVIVVLLTELFSGISRKAGGFSLCAPADVILSDDTILQPDLLYVAKPRLAIIGDRINGAPDLVVEVLSAGAERRDRVQKFTLYAQYGVPEFWIVDPKAQHIEFLILEDGRYVVTPNAGDTYQSSRLPEIVIDLRAFWRDVDDRVPQG